MCSQGLPHPQLQEAVRALSAECRKQGPALFTGSTPSANDIAEAVSAWGEAGRCKDACRNEMDGQQLSPCLLRRNPVWLSCRRPRQRRAALKRLPSLVPLAPSLAAPAPAPAL